MGGGVAFHSGHILHLSRKAYERSLLDRTSALEAVLLAAVAVECFTSELDELLSRRFSDIRQAQLITLAETLAILEEERASLLNKVDAIHLCLIGSRVDRGSREMQDLAFLFKLRNALVHRRAERFDWTTDGSENHEQHAYVKHLVQRQVIAMPSAGSPTAWGQHVLVPATAKWAHNSAVATTRLIVSWFPTGLFKETVEFHCAQWSPIAA